MKSYKKKIILYTLKTIAYTFCALGCAYQVISILNLYFSFPTTVFSFVEIKNHLELPAITFCTNNLIMLDKMKQIDPEFNQSWTKLLEISEQNSNQTRLVLLLLNFFFNLFIILFLYPLYLAKTKINRSNNTKINGSTFGL